MSRGRVGRRFTASGDGSTRVAFTVDGVASASTEMDTDDRAVAIVRTRLYDHTTTEVLRERLLREVRREDGASDKQHGTYRWTFKPVLTPGHSDTVSVETNVRSVRTLGYTAGNLRHTCEASALGEINWIGVSRVSG